MAVNLYAPAAAGLFFWCGCVAAISFLEAWLKFRAPGVTLAIGLGIGRLVFGALNRLEWVLAVGVAICVVVSGQDLRGVGWIVAAIAVLAVETFCLLPVLDRRARAHIEGVPPGRSRVHFVFVGAELVKGVSLVAAGWALIKLGVVR